MLVFSSLGCIPQTQHVNGKHEITGANGITAGKRRLRCWSGRTISTRRPGRCATRPGCMRHDHSHSVKLSHAGDLSVSYLTLTNEFRKIQARTAKALRKADRLIKFELIGWRHTALCAPVRPLRYHGSVHVAWSNKHADSLGSQNNSSHQGHEHRDDKSSKCRLASSATTAKTMCVLHHDHKQVTQVRRICVRLVVLK